VHKQGPGRFRRSCTHIVDEHKIALPDVFGLGSEERGGRFHRSVSTGRLELGFSRWKMKPFVQGNVTSCPLNSEPGSAFFFRFVHLTCLAIIFVNNYMVT
jgi:hypothetical protein